MNYLKWFRNAQKGLEHHLDEPMVLRYFEGEASEQECDRILNHIGRCAFCLQLFSAVHLQWSKEPDMALLQHQGLDRALDPERYLHQVLAAQKPRPIKKRTRLLHVLGDMLAPRPAWKLAGGLAIVMLALLIGLPHYRGWQSHRLTREAILSLRSTIFVTENDPRPAGDFAFGLFGRTRGQTGKGLPAVVQALQKAVKINPKNAEAYELLGTYYLYVENNADRAESYYLQALALDSARVDILNDLGVLSWKRGDFQRAQSLFEQALAQQPGYREALYNLAITYENLQDTTRAVQSWRTYLALESDSTWIAVASKRLTTLMRRQE